jgi:hypothetical protein
MTRYGRNIHQDLANMTNKSVDGLGVDRLVSKYAKVAEQRRRREAGYDEEFSLNIPQVERARRHIAEQLEAEAAQIHGTLPVAAIFDAYSLVKAARKRDAGVSALQGHLERMWQRDRTGSITADAYLTLHDHYKRNYPKSAAADLIKEIGERGYATLPISDLEHIASQIQSQEDFDYQIMYNGLNGGAPHQVKARRYILALLNESESSDDVDDEMEANAAEQLLNHLEEMEEILEDFAEEEDFEIEEEDEEYEVEVGDEEEESFDDDDEGEDEPPFAEPEVTNGKHGSSKGALDFSEFPSEYYDDAAEPTPGQVTYPAPGDDIMMGLESFQEGVPSVQKLFESWATNQSVTASDIQEAYRDLEVSTRRMEVQDQRFAKQTADALMQYVLDNSGRGTPVDPRTAKVLKYFEVCRRNAMRRGK